MDGPSSLALHEPSDQRGSIIGLAVALHSAKTLLRAAEYCETLISVGGSDKQLTQRHTNGADTFQAVETIADLVSLDDQGRSLLYIASAKLDLGDVPHCCRLSIQITQACVDGEAFLVQAQGFLHLPLLRPQARDVTQGHGPFPHLS